MLQYQHTYVISLYRVCFFKYCVTCWLTFKYSQCTIRKKKDNSIMRCDVLYFSCPALSDMFGLPSLSTLLRAEWKFLKLFFPVLFLYMVSLGTTFATVLFAGRIDKNHLDGIGLANTIFNVVVTSLVAGYTTVFDTYGPQVRHRNSFPSLNINLKFVSSCLLFENLKNKKIYLLVLCDFSVKGKFQLLYCIAVRLICSV